MPRFPPAMIGRPGAIPYQLPGTVVVGGPGGPPAWAPSTAYKVNQLVTNSGGVYICTVAHTSGATFAGESGNWLQVGSSASFEVTDGTTTMTGVSEINFTSGVTVSSGGTGIADVTVSGGTTGRFGPVFNVKDYGATGNGTTDDTAAFQSAITAAGSAGGGLIYVPRGTYAINGSQVSGTNLGFSYSGQLLYPALSLAQSRATIAIIGDSQAPMMQWGPQTGDNEPAHQSGSILLSNASSGAIFDVIPGANPDGGGIPYSNVEIAFENITVRRPATGTATCLKAQAAASLRTDGCSFDVNASAGTLGGTAPSSGSMGIYAPEINNAAHVSIKNTQCIGHDIGLYAAEHCTLDNFAAQLNNVGIQVGKSFHLQNWNRVLLTLNVRHIKADQATPNATIHGSVDFEDGPASKWYTTVYNIDDAGNYLRGQLYYERVISSVGQQHSLVLNGASYISTIDLTEIPRGSLVEANTMGNLASGTVAGLPAGEIMGFTWAFLGTSGSWRTSAGLAQQTVNTGGGEQIAYQQNLPTSDFVQRALITTSATSNRAQAGLAVKVIDINNYLNVEFTVLSGTNALRLQKRVGGTYTVLATAMSGTLANGHTYDLQVEYRNGTVVVYVDGTRQILYRLTSGELTTFNAVANAGLYEYVGSSSNDDGGSTWFDYSIRKP